MNAIETKNWMDYEVGQRVYFVPKGRGTARYLEVLKVGRKWVTLSELRDDLRVEKGCVTVTVPGSGYSWGWGLLYEDEESYQAKVEREKINEDLRKVDWRSLTPDQARAVHAIVFGEDLR